MNKNKKNTWQPTAYGSRFLNKNKQRYSIDELELLAVVWSFEHFKYYLFGSHFTLQTDHQALLSALKNNRGNKTYQSRLTTWVDRLLPFQFKVEHIAGKDMGFADFLSRHPNSQPTVEGINKNHEINTIESVHNTLHTTHRKLTNQIARKRRTLDDVTNHSNPTETKHSAFRHLHAIKHLPSLKFNNSNNTQLNQNYINPNSIITNHLYESPNPSITNHLFKSLSSKTNSFVISLFSRKIHITTRNNPDLNTYTVPIKK